MKTYTRWIDREYQRILLKDAKTSSGMDGEVSIDVNPHNIQQANDYLVKAMFEVSDEALDSMPIAEYSEKLQEAQKAKDFLSTKTS